jgi:Acyl-CoA dehydrogenase, C-terminal domain
VNFEIAPELRHFGESVRAAVGGWAPPTEPELATWLDDRDDELALRLERTGWKELWAEELGPAVAGAMELGRAVAPVSLLDEAALGAPLAVGGRIRHGARAETCAVPQPGWRLASAQPAAERTREPTLDGTGTVVAALSDPEPLPASEADERWDAWTAATLAYLAGLADAALETTIAHARAREQFGRPLSAMPAIQARLADAALARDGLALLAWEAAVVEPSLRLTSGGRAPALLWAGSAAREVTASAHQVHGAAGFALETGLHRYYRRAKAVQVWAAAVCEACG